MCKRRFALGIVTLVAMMSFAAAPTTQPGELVARGEALAQEKKYLQAIAAFDEALNLTNDKKLLRRAIHGRLDAYIALGKPDDALAIFDERIATNPRDAQAYIRRGQALNYMTFKMHAAHGPATTWDFDSRAIEDYTVAIRLDPKAVEAYRGRGHTKVQWNYHDEALEDLDAAVALDPTDAPTFVDRGTARWSIQKLRPSCYEDFKLAIDLDPEYAPAYAGLGRAYYTDKKYNDAIAQLDKAIALDPAFSFAYLHRGYCYYMQRNWDAAIANYNEALRHAYRPETTVLPARILAYRRAGRYDDALKDADAMVSASLYSWVAHQNRGDCLMDLQRYDAAEKEWDLAEELIRKSFEPDNPWLKSSLDEIAKSRAKMHERLEE